MLGQLEKTTILSMSRSHLLLFNVEKKYLRGRLREKKNIFGSGLYFKCKRYHNQLFMEFALPVANKPKMRILILHRNEAESDFELLPLIHTLSFIWPIRLSCWGTSLNRYGVNVWIETDNIYQREVVGCVCVTFEQPFRCLMIDWWLYTCTSFWCSRLSAQSAERSKPKQPLGGEECLANQTLPVGWYWLVRPWSLVRLENMTGLTSPMQW